MKMATIPTGGYKLMHLSKKTDKMTDAQFRLYTQLIAYWQVNGCYPSTAELMRATGWDESKVKKIRKQLRDIGAIDFTPGGWVPGQGNVSTRYTMNKAQDWWNEMVEGGGQTTPTGEGETAMSGAPDGGVSPPPKQEENSSKIKTEQNRVTGAAARTLMRQTPADTEALIRKLQQVPGKPGCRFDRLASSVLKAIERCGQTAVEDLYALVAPEKGRLPPWRLYQMLDGLEAHSDRQARPEPEPLPPDAPLIVEAKAAIQAADFNMRARAAIEARIRAAHVEFMSFWWRDNPHKLAQALARTLATEKGLTP